MITVRCLQEQPAENNPALSPCLWGLSRKKAIFPLCVGHVHSVSCNFCPGDTGGAAQGAAELSELSLSHIGNRCLGKGGHRLPQGGEHCRNTSSKWESSQGSLPNKCLNCPVFSLLKPQVVILDFALLPSHMILNASISELLQTRWHSTSTSQAVHPHCESESQQSPSSSLGLP